MIGIIGKILIDAAFLLTILAAGGYFLYSKNHDERYFHISNWLFGLQGLLLVAAAGLLLHLILGHQFQYYYVFNYTSTGLPLKYLVSAFWGGQEGSFMLWMFYATLIGLGLMKWTRKEYRGPVLFFLALTQVFLFSMIAGIHFGSFTIGASPFRTLAEALPNAPFIQTNPNFVPANGKGLNDLLQSPWMVIHPPILFFGFSLMTVPYCYAMAALWRRDYSNWIKPALPWTLGANLCLLTAIFLGGYWAYVTLSFGGYWAWDPVENASLVPWLLGTAGIHMMIVQRKNSTNQKASIVFALLAYAGVVYETFLTRSGILGDSSVHSFVDLGLYNQLLVFMGVIMLICLGMFLYRYNELPEKKEESRFLSREFLTFAGAIVLFLLGLIITIGTSSPIIGRLFHSSPTPPEISFYNNWSMPLAIIAAILTVLGQYIFWKQQDAESLARELLMPTVLACAATLATIMIADIYDLYVTLFLLAGWFALIGNGVIMIKLAVTNPRLIGGSLAHAGFGILLLGVLASSFYSSNMLDQSTRTFNKAVEERKMTRKDGTKIRQKANFIQLKLNKPTVVNNKYLLTYTGYTLKDQDRPGQQQYRIKVQRVRNTNDSTFINPQVYPASSSGGKVQWSVDPDVKSRLGSDIYLYVAGSSYVERKNKQIKKRREQAEAASATVSDDSTNTQTLAMKKGESIKVGGFKITLQSYNQTSTKGLPDSTMLAVRAQLKIHHQASGSDYTLRPLFAIFTGRDKSWTYSPPQKIPGQEVSFRFMSIDPGTGKVKLQIRGLDETYKDQWVLVVAKEKPFIGLVWTGVFVLMAGFTVSIFRHWGREKDKQRQFYS